MTTKLLFLFQSLSTTIAFSQNYEPIEIAKKLFLTDFSEIKNYSTGEFEGHPNKSDVAKNAILNFKTLTQNDSIAVVNITVTDSLGKGFDSYLHFEKEKHWKINAFRGLAQTGILERMVLEFEKMSENDIKKLMEFEKENTDPKIKSFDDLKLQVENAKLTIGLDDDIIQHFTKNKNKFTELKSKIEDYQTKNPKATHREITRHYKNELSKLLLTKFGNLYFPCKYCFVFTIGGMIDNTVGYFYQNDKAEIPQTNPSRIIMIREIGDGWYIFKTT